MNSLLQIIKTIVILSITTALFSCTGSGTSNNNDDENTEAVQSQQNEPNNTETYYLIPSPEELFRFIKDGKLKFSKSILNPSENLDTYIDTKSKELNFGVYSADLAYVASFNKYQESIDYLGAVRSLSDEIGISSVFDNILVKRIDNMMDNQDSLLKITNDTYMKIVGYLENADRQESLAQIVTGGWIESIYIVINLLESYEENPKIISLLASQKGVIENLMLYLEKRKNDSNIQETINDLTPLADFYKSLETKKKKENNKKTNNEKIIVGGNNETIMTAEQFEVLKQQITKLRNKIISKKD